MVPAWILAVGLIVLVLGTAYGVRTQMYTLMGLDLAGATAAGGKPRLWWFVDDSQVNAREWLDWGNRSTREPNEPYLKICQAKAIALWGDAFEVVPVIGRQQALERLRGLGSTPPTGVERVPPALFMPWCRAAFLEAAGGLWMDGSVLPMGSGSELRSRILGESVLMFGSDPDEGLSAAEQTEPAAGRSAGWARQSHHPMWTGLQRDLGALIAAGDPSWSAPEARRALRTLWDKHCSGVSRVDRRAEIGRDIYGRRLELEVLLTRTDWPEGSTKEGLWIVWPDGRDGLERASAFGWFPRMSVEQIRASEFNWARWATRV
jgi:hypothetical protein